MPEYTVKFAATIIVNGSMTIQADNEDNAEQIASDIAKEMNSNPPLSWQPLTKVVYKAEWEEDSIEIDVIEVI